jgi:hypothetical protein
MIGVPADIQMRYLSNLNKINVFYPKDGGSVFLQNKCIRRHIAKDSNLNSGFELCTSRLYARIVDAKSTCSVTTVNCPSWLQLASRTFKKKKNCAGTYVTMIHNNGTEHKPLLLLLHATIRRVFPISILGVQFPVSGIFVQSGK